MKTPLPSRLSAAFLHGIVIASLAQTLIRDVAGGLTYLHTQEMVNRDTCLADSGSLTIVSYPTNCLSINVQTLKCGYCNGATRNAPVPKPQPHTHTLPNTHYALPLSIYTPLSENADFGMWLRFSDSMQPPGGGQLAVECEKHRGSLRGRRRIPAGERVIG